MRENFFVVLVIVGIMALYGLMIHLTCKSTGLDTVVISGNTVSCK